MKEIIFGTTNEAKVNQVRGALLPANITVLGVSPETKLPDIAEDGHTAIENARQKATAYAAALGKPVLSMDNALYINGLAPELQPGLYVRRVDRLGNRPTDADLLNHYSQLFDSLGNNITGYWEYGLCLATPEGKVFEISLKSNRIFTSHPSDILLAGLPLASLSIEPATGKYISELTQDEQDIFWQRQIGDPLLKFLQSINT